MYNVHGEFEKNTKIFIIIIKRKKKNLRCHSRKKLAFGVLWDSGRQETRTLVFQRSINRQLYTYPRTL